jgi:hypothetical protein
MPPDCSGCLISACTSLHKTTPIDNRGWTSLHVTHARIHRAACCPLFHRARTDAKTGKRFEWEVRAGSHNPLSALFQDYDWADEVLHPRIGRDWYLIGRTR